MTPLAKRLLHASFVLSFLLAFLALHAGVSTGLQAPPRSELYSDPVLLRLGIPGALAGALILACGAAYLFCVVGAVATLRRHAGARALLPVVSLILSQALWFVVPSLLDVTRAWSARSLAFAAIWISAAHSTQYLWITFHYAKRSGAGTQLRAFLLKTTLAGNAAIVVPGILFAPMLLGSSLSWETGLSTLVFAVINIHHFMLDGAVWKLRDGRVARVLLRDGGEPPRAPTARKRRVWRRFSTALWALCAACLAIELAELARHQAQRWGAHDLARAMFEALDWAGRDHAIQRVRFGRALLRQRDYAGAQLEFEKSLRASPTAGAWGGLGRALDGQRDFAAAAEAYEGGLAVDPNDSALLRSAARARSRLGDHARAVELLTRARDLEPGNPVNRQLLDRALQRLDASRERDGP